MVNLSGKCKKSHLLKPCSTSTHGFEAFPTLKALSFSVSFTGWRFANIKFKSWATKMAISYSPIWKQAGIFEAVMASTATIHKDIDLVLGIAEKWCPKTNTFVFPWGETTITLEDVMVLLDFSVLGSPVFAELDSEGERIKVKLGKEWGNIKLNYVTHVAWMKRFEGCGDDELEHVAFLALWLCYFVFPSNYYHVYKSIFPIAVHLSRGTRIALAPAVLAHLYAELSILKTHMRVFTESIDANRIALSGLFKLVQVWAWERFKELQPAPNELVNGEPRLALWHNLQHRSREVRRVLNNSKLDSFEWRPYTKHVENWELPQFYPEKAMLVTVGPNHDDEFVSFARCVKVSELVGIDCVEHYFPNRVASQFGMLQDDPGPVKRNRLSQEAAWSDYSKPIDDLTIFIPSRSAVLCDTPVSSDWWRNSSPESDETLEPRNSTCFVPSSSMEKRTSEDARKIAENFRKKRLKYMKRACENNESAMGRCQKQIAIENDEEDGGLHIAKKRKTCEDELEVYEGNAVKMTIIDDGSKEPECLVPEDGVVVLEKARSGEKEVDDDSEEPECLLPENGVIAGDKESSGEKEDDAVGLIQQKLAVQELASKAHNNAFGSEETRKTNEHKLKDSYEKTLHKLKRLESTIEELFINANEDLARLMNREP